MVNLEQEIGYLRDVKRLKEIMDENIRSHPDFYRERMRLLDEFFADRTDPVDICVILYGGLSDAHHLAYHIEENNLIFYRPKATHKRTVNQNFLIGETHIDRELLLFDQDMITGNAMRETADFFADLGYDRSKISGYLDTGCRWRKYVTPELMLIDDLLKK